MWIVPMQTASYKGVSFEVVAVNDSADRAVVEHLYPYINGGDLEDMGLNAKQVQMQAMFNGDGYYTKLKQFLNVMEEKGSGVLVHPILGRMPEMICVSYSISHDAENVNYCSVDLTFKEATEALSTLVFQSPLFSQFDSLFNAIDGYVEQAMGWYATYMGAYSAISGFKNKLLGYWGAVFGVVSMVKHFFKSGKTSQALPKSVSKQTVKSQSVQAMKLLDAELSEGFKAVLKRNQLSQNAGFNEILKTAKEIEVLPAHLISGKGETANNRYDYLNLGGAKLRKEDGVAIGCALKLLCSAQVVKSAVEIMEDFSETLTPREIEYMATQCRLSLLASLNSLRTLQKADEVERKVGEPNSDVYLVSYQMAEEIRALAHLVTRLAIALINQKPPLMVKTAPLNGTLQQVAHALYGDYRRFDELLRLNPDIREPNFIAEGDLLNAYAK